MAHYDEKPGFRNITEVRNFLYGTNNRKHSKVYLRIKEQDGHYFLTIWTDNNFTADEVTGGEAFLKEINGFKERYQLKMNKVEPDLDIYQKIVALALPKIAEANKDFNVKEVFAMLDKWVKEFTEYWGYECIACEHPDKDFDTELKEFVEKKLNTLSLPTKQMPEKDEFLIEAIQDITTVAVDMVSKETEDEGYDSRELFSECRRWGEEFEKMWNGYVEAGEEDDHDYMLEVEEFAEKKAKEYLGI